MHAVICINALGFNLIKCSVLVITTDEMSGAASEPGKTNSCQNVNDIKPKGIINPVRG